MLGAQGSPYLARDNFQFNFGYRWQYSDRHYTGDHHERNRAHQNSEVINDIHLLDIGLTYAFTERLNLSASIPYFIGERSQSIAANTRDRNETNAEGFGDMSLLASLWILDTAEHTDGNFALGIGPKFPTGRDNVRDNFRQSNGSFPRRSVDQSIQPGDGGYGFSIDFRGFQQVHERVTLYAAGAYLFNPENMNHTRTFRGQPEEAEMSIADQYVARAGVAFALAPEDGWTVSFGVRAEGVPDRDLLGHSDGFRRPGIAVSVEPGLIYVLRQHTFSFSVPVAVYRNRHKSIPDERRMPVDGHGDAAFADFLVLFGYSLRFDAPWNWGSTPPEGATPAATGIEIPDPGALN